MRSVPHIRPGEPADSAAIAEVHQLSRAASLGHHLTRSQLDPLGMPHRVRRWEQWMETEGYHLHVAEAHGTILGFSSWRPAPDADLAGLRAGGVHTLYVRPSYWGCGVGSLLLTADLRRMRRVGLLRAVVWTLEINERARQFYARHGFARDGAHLQDRLHDGEAFVGLRYALPLGRIHPAASGS